MSTQPSPPEATGWRAEARGAATALVPGAAGALVAALLMVPAPFIIGPALAVTLAGLAGMKPHIPVALRNAVFVVIGAVMGSGVTPKVIETASAWPQSFLLLGLSIALIVAICMRVLERWFAHSRRTAVLASSPGHLSFVLGLGAEIRADLPAIGIIQSIRLLCLTLAVPLIVTAAGYELRGVVALAPNDAALPALAAMLAVAGLLGLALQKLRMPAAFLIGGMFVSTAAHLSGVVEGAVPVWLADPSYVVMGSLIGSRFAGVTLRQLRRHALAGLATTVVAVAVAAAGAWVAAATTGLPLGQTMIAFAPGGVETMSALAPLMQADPAYVAAHHVLRLFILTGLVPLFLGASRRQD